MKWRTLRVSLEPYAGRLARTDPWGVYNRMKTNEDYIPTPESKKSPVQIRQEALIIIINARFIPCNCRE